MGLLARNSAMLMTSVAMVVVWGAGAAFAQSTTTATTNRNAGNVTLLERLVIGAGAEKVAIDTPQAVTVLDQEDLDRQQAMSIAETLGSVPGVSITGSERIMGQSFNIRGIGSAESSGDESRLIVTVDGAKKFYEQYRMGSFFSDPELYKQVEVLRGPASSTLYGSGAIGGVINFTTKDASDFIKDGQTGALRVKGTYTSNGQGTLTSGLLAHRFNEGFEVLAAGNWRRSDEFELANGTNLVGSNFDAFSGLIKGTARFGENDEQSLRLSYQRWQSDADDQPYSNTGTITGSTAALFGNIDREVVDQTAVLQYANEDLDNPWVDLKVNLSYSDTNVDQSNATGPAAMSFGNAEYGYRTWQASIENTSEFSGENWENFLTYGVQYSFQDRIAVASSGTGVIGTHPEGQDTRLGLFVQNEFIYDDRLTIIPGVRGDFVWQSPEVSNALQRDVEDFAFSPKLAALYDFNDNFSIFGSVAHTERLPSLDELFQYSGARTPSLQLDKETSNNFEAGFALSGIDLFQSNDQASVKVTSFYSDIDGLIAAGPSPGPYFVNINNAEIWGVEVEGSYESDYFFTRLAYTATFGENSDTGAKLTSIPAHKLVATVGGRAIEYGLEYGATVTVAAKADTGVAPAVGTSLETDSWAKLDLFASWKPEEGAFAGTEARFGIDNVFDADYRDNQTPDRSLGRTFKLTLAKQFDY